MHIFARKALLQKGWADDVRFTIADGRIADIQRGTAVEGGEFAAGVVIPGLGNAHSHAFQRALAGRTERRSPRGKDNFWTWRERMYELAGELDPESLAAIAAQAYSEMLASGYTGVAEFHYLHRPAGATQVDTDMFDALRTAAGQSGIRMHYVPVLYQRAGFDEPQPQGHQAQFALAHEALHCALSHFSRREHRDRHRWDIACDLAINPLLIKEGMTAPPGALYDVGFEGMMAEEIYPYIKDDTEQETHDEHLYGKDSDSRDDSSQQTETDAGDSREGEEQGVGDEGPADRRQADEGREVEGVEEGFAVDHVRPVVAALEDQPLGRALPVVDETPVVALGVVDVGVPGAENGDRGEFVAVGAREVDHGADVDLGDVGAPGLEDADHAELALDLGGARRLQLLSVTQHVVLEILS